MSFSVSSVNSLASARSIRNAEHRGVVRCQVARARVAVRPQAVRAEVETRAPSGLGRAAALKPQRAPRGSPMRAAGSDTEPPPAPAPVKEDDVAAEVGLLLLRVGVGTLMFHNGLDKLADPAGFSQFVVEKYLGFLPGPLLWTYAAIAAELAGPVGLVLGAFTRISAATLLGTMGLAVIFHINDTGLQGFPFAVVPEHQYSFEPAALYALIFAYFVAKGGGKFSVDSFLSKDDK